VSVSDALDGLSLSLSDIALLARVKRPVVTVWRRRSAASGLPFPAPLPSGGRQELFDAQQVVIWLEATDRGNNPSAREDAAAFSEVGGGSNRTEDHVFYGLSALLCLGVVSGERLGELDEARLLDLADEADPDDEFLYTEVEELGDQITSVARYADLLADAAFSPAEAFETLVRSRNRGRGSVETTQTLAEPARDLVARLTVALAQEAGLATPTFVDPTQGGGDLLVAAVDQLGEDRAAISRTGDYDDPASRLARRRLRVHDIPRQAVPVTDDGAYEISEPAVHVARFPASASPAMSTDEILTAIDNIVLQMNDAHESVAMTPVELAAVLGVSPKSVRAWLRRTYSGSPLISTSVGT
jgi:hypothetical protein